MPPPVLECRNIAFERDDLPLFEEVSFSLHSGRALRIMGANGTGKTTLLRILATALYPTRGTLLWRGQAIEQCRQLYRSSLIYLGHNPGIKFALTPLENLRWFFRLHSCRPVNFEETLGKVGLAGNENTPCHMLSAGQMRRVALARLYLSPAQLWILDEPFTSIDIIGVGALEELMSNHLAGGGSILITTHQPFALPEVDSLALEPYAYAA